MSTPTTPFDSLRLDASALSRSVLRAVRSTILVAGSAAIIIGALLLFWPTKSLQVAAVLLGIYFLISGVARILLAVSTPGLSVGLRVLDLIFGVLFLVGGVFMLRNSVLAAATLAVVIGFIVGISWIVEGVLALVESGSAASRGWAIAFGIISILAGATVLVVPAWSTVWLVIFTGAALLVSGIVAVVRGIRLGRDAESALDDAVIEGTVVDH